MRHTSLLVLFVFSAFLLNACSSYSTNTARPVNLAARPIPQPPQDYSKRIPQYVQTHGEKAVVVYPNVHAWGAYSSDGALIRAGLATAGSDWCPDLHRRCHTKVGTFRIQSLGSANCKSTIFPLPKGGAPMPYCMFFNGNQGLHGSYSVVDANASHGCVRMQVSDAEWMRFNFARIGTKVIVRPYEYN
jgi:hypothetical protein